jgi:hypothetical protein
MTELNNVKCSSDKKISFSLSHDESETSLFNDNLYQIPYNYFEMPSKREAEKR